MTNQNKYCLNSKFKKHIYYSFNSKLFLIFYNCKIKNWWHWRMSAKMQTEPTDTKPKYLYEQESLKKDETDIGQVLLDK